MRSWTFLIAACALALLGAEAGAQTQPERAELLARQQALFDRLVARPDDLETMFDYAAVSMRLQDYEPAIATLERMLIFNRDLPRVKLELGVAYFRLGAYDVARFYFSEALQDDPPDEVVARVTPFLSAIAERTAQSAFSGFVSIGPVYSTNANLAPTDREVTGLVFIPVLGDFDTATITLDDGAKDVGVRATAVLNHRYDLRRPNDDEWRTSLVYSGLRYRKEQDGEFDAVDLQTGPSLALDDRAFGPKARPFAQLGLVRAANDPLYVMGGGGVEYADTLSQTLALFALGNLQRRDFEDDSDDFDGLYGFVSGGLAYSGVPDTLLRGSLFYETDRVDADHQSNHEVGVRVTAARDVAVAGYEGFETFRAPWRVSLFGQASLRRFEEPDPDFEPGTTREDTDMRVGLRVLAPLEGGWAVSADTAYFRRESSIVLNDLDNFEVGFSVIKSF
jgi:tetratricopeptide (TPR) repeat protein